MEDEREHFLSQRFNRLVIFYLDTEYLNWAVDFTDKRLDNMVIKSGEVFMRGQRACCIYDQDEIIFCGDEAYQKKNEITDLTQYMDDFLIRLYQVYTGVYVTKTKQIKEENKVLSGFAAILQKVLPEILRETGESTAAVRYIFIVPNHWNTEFRNTIIRPAFTEAGYTSNQDSSDRLLFYTKLECQVQLLQMSQIGETPFEFAEVMKRNRHCFLREIYYFGKGEVAWETITSFEAVERNVLEGGCMTVKNFKVLKTSQVQYYTEAYTNLKELLISHGVSDATDNLSQQEFLEIIMRKYLDYVLNRNEADNAKESMEDTIQYPFKHCDFEEWPDINKSKLDTITDTELEQAVFSHYIGEFHSKFKPTAGDNKRSAVFSFYVEHNNYYFEIPRLFSHCLTLMLQKNHHTNLLMRKSSFAVIRLDDLLYAAFTLSSEAARLSDLKSPTNFISLKDYDVTALKEAEVIVRIDISLKSSSVSYISNKKNAVSFKSGNLAQETQSLSLDHFIKIDRQNTVLTVEQWVKEMIENEFSDPLTFFSAYDLYLKTMDDDSRKKAYTAKKLDPFVEKPKNYFENISVETKAKISSIFTVAENDTTVKLNEERYKNTFIMIYLKYLVDIVHKEIGEYPLENIRYFISVEKLVLQFCFDDSHNRIKEIVQACGISVNFKITTQGDGLLSSLQKECQVEIPVKSFFVQAQLYEDYLHTTLYQAIEESAAITLKSDMIPLGNLYESMAAYMWNYIQENQKRVHYCEEHAKNRLNSSSIERFLLYFKAVFFKNFIENMTLNSKIDKETKFQISDQCNCHFYMTHRNIMKLVIEPTFLKRIIAETISITTSKAFYGHYRIHHLFFINFSPSLHHSMQLLMDNYLEDYRLHIQAYIIPTPVHQLLIPTTYFIKSPFQVSSRNIGIYLQLSTPYDALELEFNTLFTESNRMLQKNEFPLILAKGEPVLERCIIKRFLLDPPLDSKCDIRADIFAIYDELTVVRYSDENIAAVDAPFESIIGLGSYMGYNMEIRDKLNIAVVIEFQNYASDIKMWVKFEDDDLHSTDPSNFAEPLTVAYI